MQTRRPTVTLILVAGFGLAGVAAPVWAAARDSGRFPRILAENTTGFPDSTFTGPPDDTYGGIDSNESVVYEFDCGYIYDGPGGDFNVYEVDFGADEFYKIDVLISADGAAFVRVNHTVGDAVRIPGDEAHDDLEFARSYDLNVTGLQSVRFVMIEGEESGFDLDAIGAIHFANTCDVDGDGVDNAIDVCDNTPAGAAVDAEGRPLGDVNRDCDTDLEDYVLFEWGFTGPLAGHVQVLTVIVGNPGNANDTFGDGYGRVDYVYNIGKYEITAGQYTAFLNAVAATDTYGLYNDSMWSSSYGCKIERSGSSGSYSYSVASDWVDRPVNYVSWGDAARFANWLHNGQPTGAQDLTTTEDGSYFLDGALSEVELVAITREPDATWVIPSEHEWYKAAYHKNDCMPGSYFDYPTKSDSSPSSELIDPDPGNNATFYAGIYTIGGPYWRTKVGAHQNSDSPYGTFDQGGNVWEWNEAVLSSSYRGLRGGSFTSGHTSLHASTSVGYAPTSVFYDIGFRVAKVP
jgi:formylglycine-generating enzyme required for sulfatase activity